LLKFYQNAFTIFLLKKEQKKLSKM